MSYETEEWYKVWRKAEFGSKNDMRNWMNFNVSSRKSENLHFDVLILHIMFESKK